MTGVAKSKELSSENSKFQFSFSATFTTETVNGKPLRRFSGIGYSGEVISRHWFWGNVIFDLTTMSVPAKLPALINHDRNQRAGYSSDSRIDVSSGLTVAGVLLSNEHGASVAQDSDEGFPWQMSVDISPGIVEEVKPGSKVTVNGKVYDGPLTVFKNSTISEVSFTPTGWDANTVASAMSRAAINNPTNQTTGVTKVDEAEAQALKDKNKELSDKLTEFSRRAREADVKLLFSETGQKYEESSAEVKELMAMSDEAFNASAKFVRSQFSKFASNASNAGKQGETNTGSVAGSAATAGLTQHFATNGAIAPEAGNANGQNGQQSQQSQQGGPRKFSLVENARKRTTEFSKQRSA